MSDADADDLFGSTEDGGDEAAAHAPLDLDMALLSALLAEGPPAYLKVRTLGLAVDHLRSPADAVFTFLQEYLKTYKAFPAPGVVEAKFAVVLPPVAASAEFLAGEVLHRKVQTALLKTVADLTGALERRNTVDAVSIMRAGIRDATEVGGKASVVPLSKVAKEVEARYDLLKGGLRGIATPWPTLNEVTLGIWPEDLWVFVARQAVGKTQVVMLLAMLAWKMGYRVLFVAPEMSRVAVMRRMLAVELKLPAREFRRGELLDTEEQIFRSRVVELTGVEDTFFFATGAFGGVTEASLESAIGETEPHLIIADAPYLFRMGGKDRMDNTARAFGFLKGVVSGTDMATIANMQFNRAGAKEVAIENVGLTDTAGWNADYMGALSQTPEQKLDRRLLLTSMKVRDAEMPDPILLNWNYRDSDFSEVPPAAALPPYTPGVDALPPPKDPPSTDPVPF